MERDYGYRPSILDGTEYVFDVQENTSLPETYSYIKFLPPVLNQGATNTCVPHSLEAHLDWNHNVDGGGQSFNTNDIAMRDIYEARSNKYEDVGMTFKDALDYLRKTGVRSGDGTMKIRGYARVLSDLGLKYALVMNGPCVGALRVFNEGPQFWHQEWSGQEFLGGHAIAIVGYNKEGFIIRNSWGRGWADHGYTIIPYDEVNNFLEIWTIFD